MTYQQRKAKKARVEIIKCVLLGIGTAILCSGMLYVAWVAHAA